MGENGCTSDTRPSRRRCATSCAPTTPAPHPRDPEQMHEGEGVGPVPRQIVRRWRPTAGSASAGRPSTAARAARPSSSSSSSTSRCGPARRCRCSPSTPSPTIMKYGSEEQKAFFLPKILAGEIHFASATPSPTRAPTWRRSDPGRARRRRVRHQRPEDLHQPRHRRRLHLAGGAHRPRGKKHKGISIIIVPPTRRASRSSPSSTWASTTSTPPSTTTCACPPPTWSARRTAAGASSPTSSTTSASRCAASGIIERQLTDVPEWAQQTKLADGTPGHRPGVGAAQPRARARPARVPAPHQLEGRLDGRAGPARPRRRLTMKVFGTEFYMEALRELLMEVLGPRANLRAAAPGAVLNGKLNTCYRGLHILTFGGGTNEMQRDLIAMFGLEHAPRPPRSPKHRTPTAERTDGLLAHRRQQALLDLAARSSADRCTLERLKEIERGDAVATTPTSGASWPVPTWSASRSPRPSAGAASASSTSCLAARPGRPPRRARALLGRRRAGAADRRARHRGPAAQCCPASRPARCPHRGAAGAVVRPRPAPTTRRARRRRLAPRRREDSRCPTRTSRGGARARRDRRRRVACSSSTRRRRGHPEPPGHQSAVADLRLDLDGVRGRRRCAARRRPADGAEMLASLDRARWSRCARFARRLRRGLRMTAEYTTNRKQFERPISASTTRTTWPSPARAAPKLTRRVFNKQSTCVGPATRAHAARLLRARLRGRAGLRDRPPLPARAPKSAPTR
jgi:3-oxocholest-4-en-26-oyl-CoA dehydrogenase alpha subunit